MDIRATMRATNVDSKSGVGIGGLRWQRLGNRSLNRRLQFGVPPGVGVSATFEQPAANRARASRPGNLMAHLLASVRVPNQRITEWGICPNGDHQVVLKGQEPRL